ncbi:hypothetical protein [Ornithinimicrobium sp. Y1694]|uniref:hypothetical protein n=1 Tax=Ornithinimicrobium sp. Y1694 TaxID=3418590 RepID=UPI003CE7164E
MTSPDPGQGAGAAAAQPAGAPAQSGGATAAAPGTPATQQQAGQQPVTQGTPDGQSTRTSRFASTPARMRIARALATGAALLTGILATGTFDTSGVNATPNVLAAQWQAAEATGVEIAGADLEAARLVAAEGDAPDSREALTEHLAEAAAAQSGSGSGDPTEARDIVRVTVLSGQAAEQAVTDQEAAATTLDEASTLARQVAERSDALARDHASTLAAGSRSGLAATVGVLTTAALIGVLVFMALRTRRILNVPLLAATLITGWLTFSSMNPAALPLNLQDRVDEGSRTATALQEVLQAGQAGYAVALGSDLDLGSELSSATQAVDELDNSSLSESWRTVASGLEGITEAEGQQARLDVVQGQRSDLDGVISELRERFDQQESVSGAVGTSAAVGSGLALVLGVVAAGLAWFGITRRLQDYR